MLISFLIFTFLFLNNTHATNDGTLVPVTSHEFKKNNENWIVFYSADWCGGCRRFKPTFVDAYA